MEMNLYLNASPPPQFPDNLSMNNNSHCKLHFWKLKVILRYFRRPLLVFQDQDAVPMGLWNNWLIQRNLPKCTQRHSWRD